MSPPIKYAKGNILYETSYPTGLKIYLFSLTLKIKKTKKAYSKETPI